MDDLKSVTVSYLRDLARKHLGPGYSKLTKTELIAALARFVPALKKLAKQQSAQKVPEKRRVPERKKEPEGNKVAQRKNPKGKKGSRKKGPKVKKAAKPPEPKKAAPASKKARSAAAKAEELAQSLRPAQVVNFPPRPRSYRSADGSWNEDAAGTAAERAAGSHPAEPLLEGFFVARVAGERELRRHHLTEEQAPRAATSNAPGDEENLGELPVDYASDVAMALARDPHTLFVSWDFTPATRARAIEGLDSPRPVLRVYEGDRLVRVEEFALESRSFYIHGLPPGRSYRVEAHLVGRDGRSRRIGPSTHPVLLPQVGLSQDTAVRFMRMPPPPPPTVRPVAQQPLAAPPGPTPPGFIGEGEFITWHRIALPSSADAAEVPESRRGRMQRQAAAPPGPARPAHLQISVRPLGASEQIHWTPPPSGRGR